MKDPNEEEAIQLHVAGATVQHRSPFKHLETFQNKEQLSREFLDKWVIPFYMRFAETSEEWIQELIERKPAITKEVIEKNLGDFNWRTRTTGAYFAAITNRPEYIDIIGTHLLKSEVCCAGDVYCDVLASFNLPSCVDYINRYLDYYLKKRDLWFDQGSAMEAILYLDEINSTSNFDRHYPTWLKFIQNKPNWDKTVKADSIRRRLGVIERVRECSQ